MTYVIHISCQMSLREDNLKITCFKMGFEKTIKYAFGISLIAGLGYATGVGVIALSDKNPKEISEKKIVSIKDESSYKMAQAIYGEAANQPEKTRELVGRVILNRVGKKGYASNIEEVITGGNNFSCVTCKKNKNWRQATGELEMNNYEKMIFKRCLQDAKDVLNGKKIGVLRENELVAYHDVSIEKPKDRYWDSLEKVFKQGRLVFYAPKN